jgi:hypothetical protein
LATLYLRSAYPEHLPFGQVKLWAAGPKPSRLNQIQEQGAAYGDGYRTHQRIRNGADQSKTGAMRTVVQILTLLLLLAGCNDPDDLLLQCKGDVSSFMPSVWTQNDEHIAVRISDKKVSFSGNGLLLGKNITICRDGDDIYFDSDTCDNRKTTQNRQYGTYNRILMTLDLTNTTDRIGITGRFKCTKAGT